MKRTPARGVKQNLKPCAYSRSEDGSRVRGLRLTACLWETEPASQSAWRAKGLKARSRSESECEERAESRGLGPKPGELSMDRALARTRLWCKTVG